MFWIPLLPSIPLPIYRQLYIPMVVMAWFVSFQFATVIWLEMRTSACGTVSPACRASSTSAVPWPHLEHCWLLWKQHSTEFWRTGRCWGDYSSFARDVPVLSCKLIPCAISLGLSGHITFALWKPRGLWLLLPMRVCRKKRFCTSGSIPSELHCPIPLVLFVCSGVIFLYMLCHVLQREVREGKGGWDGCPPAEPSRQFPKSSSARWAGNTKMRSAHGQPWEAASAQMLQSFRAGETKHTQMHRHSDKALFSPLQRPYFEGDQICCVLILYEVS